MTGRPPFPAAAICLLAAALGAAAGEPGGRPEIRLAASGPAAVELAGLDPADLAALAGAGLDRAAWSRAFPVRVEGSDPDASPPVVGTYRVVGKVVRFEPRYPFEPGLAYRAAFDPSKLVGLDLDLAAGPVAGRVALPPPPEALPTAVEAAYPSASVLPENLLKFYLQFTGPMARGRAYEHVRLVDAAGEPVELAFLELGEELWSPDGTRLTLLLDPGRIKQGLRPREELGPILVAGRDYALEVDPAWPDAAGRPLAVAFRKPFRAGPADETSPDPAAWTVEPPRAGTVNALVVTFPGPLDAAMLRRVLVVRAPDGSARPGIVSLADDETRWEFRPSDPWTAGAYALEVDADLEDLAGNSVARPFEVDVLEPVARTPRRATRTIPFRVAGD